MIVKAESSNKSLNFFTLDNPSYPIRNILK